MRKLLFAVAVLLGCAAVAQDYTQWRGLNRDGSASGFIEPKAWPDALTQKWKVEVGEGYATPLVVGKTVYTFTRRGGDEVIAALDAATGKERWHTAYPAPYDPLAPAAPHGRGPKATPLFHNGKLYTMGISGIVSAFDAVSGKLLWQKPGPKEPPPFGDAVSPAGDKGLVIFHVGPEGPVTALDANTGAEKWSWPGTGPGYGSPMIAEFGGTRQVVVITQASLAGLSLAYGALLWEHGGLPRNSTSHLTPLFYGDTVIFGGPGYSVRAVRPVLRDGKWSAELLWDTKDVLMFLTNPVLVGDTLFGMSMKAKGQFFALDAKTGKVLWLGPSGAASNTAAVKAGNLIFLLKDDGELIVSKANQTAFEPLKKYKVADSATWAQPAISGNRIFVKDVNSLTLWTVN